jgi:hypothetical protein
VSSIRRDFAEALLGKEEHQVAQKPWQHWKKAIAKKSKISKPQTA